MSKITYALLSVYFIEFALWLFAGSELSGTTLFGLLLDPQNLLSNPFYIIMVAAIVFFSASIIVPGSIFAQVNIYALYAGLVATFITFTSTIVHLYTYLTGGNIGVVASGIEGSPYASIIAMIFIGPLMIFYIIAVVEWVRQN